jgi:RNA polymerase sigma-70 factor (ECF subfamily)
MADDAVAEQERMRTFQAAALPHLDDVYTLARYLMRNMQDAEDAAQECYLRALRHFDSYRGPAMKLWLLAILRNACAEFTRRGRGEVLTDYAQDESVAEEMPMRQEPQASPEKVIQQQLDRGYDTLFGGGAARAIPRSHRAAIFLTRKLMKSPAYLWEQSCREYSAR